MGRMILFIIGVYISVVVQAQNFYLDSIFEPKLIGEIFQQRTDMIGKQCYNDEWAIGDIKLATGEWVTNKLLKYNTYLDQLIWFQPDSLRQIRLEKHFIAEFCFKNYKGKSVRFKRIRAKLSQMIDSSDIFVEVLLEKKAAFYIFRSAKIEGSDNILKGGVLYSLDKLVPSPLYLISLPDKKTITFKKIRRGVLMKAFPEEYKTRLKELMQQNHLSIRTESDLAKLVSLIN